MAARCRLGDAEKVIVRARAPACGVHVELEGLGELVRMPGFGGAARIGVGDGVHAKPGAMGEESFALFVIKIEERLPKLPGAFGERFSPSPVPGLDGLGRGELAKARERRAKAAVRFDLQAAVAGIAVKQGERQHMQHGKKGRIGIAGKRIA